jgi:hypothetical protein
MTTRNPSRSKPVAKPATASGKVRSATPGTAKRSLGPKATEQAEVKALLEKINRTLDETEAILASTIR